MASELIKLGGLWINTDKNGKQYLTGRLSPTVRILIFKNEFRAAENQPAYQMYLAPVEQQPDDPARAERESDEFLVDDLPAAEETAPPARPAPAPARTAAPAPRAAAPAPRAAAPAPRPAAGRPAPRQAAPPPDFDDMEDPFAE